MKINVQQSFEFKMHGGRRKGSGRKKLVPNEPVHNTRPKITRHIPFHCGLKLHKDAPGLRNETMFNAIKAAFNRSQRKGLRVTEYSIESNHIHLIGEADTTEQMSRGMMSLAASITWALRKAFSYFGPVFAKRYFVHAITKPREMLHALIYVLFNHAKHLNVKRFVDRYSSASLFMDLNLLMERPPAPLPRPQDSPSRPESWLQRFGWKKSVTRYGIPVSPAPRKPRTVSRALP